MELKGTIVQNLGIEKGTSKSGKDWQKASIVIETEGQYPKKVHLTNFKEAEKFAALPQGTKATFSIEVESREWTNKTTGKTSWFTEVSCWRWTVDNAAPTPAAEAPKPENEEDSFPF